MNDSLCSRIARLVEERGWNQDEFARQSGLHRLTVRNIFADGSQRLHNATVNACARSLGVSVRELHEVPLERLLPRMRIPWPATESDRLKRLFDEATQPELLKWAEEEPDKARTLTDLEWDELLSLQGTGGPLTREGVEKHVNFLARRRKLLAEVTVIAGTEYLEFLEQMVELLYEKVQPYRDRA